MCSTVEETACDAVADLIRSRADALRILAVLQAHAQFKGLGLDYCQRIQTLLEQWDQPTFGEEHAREIWQWCREFDVLMQARCDMLQLGALRVPLEALMFAAGRRVRSDSDVTGG